MELRPLVTDDRGAAIALWAAAGLTRPWNDPADDFDRAVAGATSEVVGAFRGDDLVGTVMVGDDGHRGWVYYLAVSDDHRGSGVGRFLMAAAERRLATRGVAKLNLMVRAANAGVVGFYEQLGYATDEVVVMSRRLDLPVDR